MKAMDYYKIYGEAVLAESYHEDQHNELEKLIFAFLREMKAIIDSRRIVTARGAVSVIKEMNEKWNALSDLFKENNGVTPLKRNGFMNLMKFKIPELERWNKKWQRKS